MDHGQELFQAVDGLSACNLHLELLLLTEVLVLVGAVVGAGVGAGWCIGVGARVVVVVGASWC
eukprot:1591785-Karenia_brevis.AAC.1